MENDQEKCGKRDKVTDILHTPTLAEYRRVANDINERDDVGMICIQHEFGLFGGDFGENILSFMLAVNKPIILVFHTVLPNPESKLKSIVTALCDLSEKVIVLTENSRKILNNEYNIIKEKIKVIPHGTHSVLWKDKEKLKSKYGFTENIILSTFGLLSANKNIETVLYALPEIVKRYPNIILGKAHPEVFKNEGEKYRQRLTEIIISLNLTANVQFVNKYLELEEVLNYLNLSDLYLFSSKDPNQAVSGTLAYAMSTGCPVISTPFPHAKELINDSNGILLNDFNDPKQLPEINTLHFEELTTNFGMLQFSEFDTPDPTSGYTLDDNAHALIAIIMHYEKFNKEDSLNLAARYLNFIDFVQQDNGWFQSNVDTNGKISSKNLEVNLEDANGRALWSLGYVLSKKPLLPNNIISTAENCFVKALPKITSLSSPRAISFALKGLYYFNTTSDKSVETLTEIMVEKLLGYYELTSDQDWNWYKDYLTFANSVLPEAMMYAYLILGNKKYKEIAEVTFDFLLSQYFMKGKIQVIPNKGWFHKRNERTFFGEQPIEVAYTIFTLELFYQVTQKIKYKEQLQIAFSWFLGNNHLTQIMYNPVNGGSYDGLEKESININQGAESTVCFLLARLVIDKWATKNKSETFNIMSYES